MINILDNIDYLQNNIEDILLNIIFILSIICVFYIIISNNIIHSIVLLSGLSLLIALIYLLLDAPDVAITEASIGACISTVIMIISLAYIGDKSDKTKFSLAGFIAVTILAISLFLILDDLPIYGDLNSNINNELYKYYIQNSGKEIAIPSITASILANYRSYDTLAETSVILTASFAIIAIFSKSKNKT